MNEKAHRYLTLFLTTLEISAFTFGGGYVIIPLMRKTFVGKLKWIEDGEMLDLAAIAQSSPVPGALLSILGAVLPPLVIISVISAFYQAFRSNRYVSLCMNAMSAGVAAVVIDVVISMVGDVLKMKRVLPVAMLIITFILVQFFNVNIMIMILVAGFVGYLDYLFSRRKAS